ncbi:hypothetical protein [Burkholderia phage FLC9]|nr:hypothetical protein [Burkholderia phage FLC9]
MATTQNNSNKTALYVLLGFVAVIVVGALLALVTLVSAYNRGNRFENRIEAVYSNNQNILSNYTEKVQEAAQVTDMQKSDIKDVIVSALQGRYGKDGAKAVFQAIHEQNPQIDSTVYKKLQEIIVAGRDEFQNNQTTLIDVTRSYKTALGSMPGGFMMHLVGYPHLDLDKYKPLVNGDVQKQFESGKSHAINLRPASQ